METPQKLLVIDGMNLTRTVYEGNPADDSPEKVAACIRNSLSSFGRALDEHRPTHAVAVFDYGGQTWRHELYPQYKAHRKPIYPPLREAMPHLWNTLRSRFGLVTVSIKGSEADDVIATLVHRWRDRCKDRAIVVSNDKDLCQLITLGIDIRDHFKPAWRDADWVREKFLVEPNQLRDALALAGDSSDGIPGVSGIGKKTAAKLINDYGDLEHILVAARTLPGKAATNIVAEAEMARLSLKLVSLRNDESVGLSWNDMRIQEPLQPRNAMVQPPQPETPIKSTLQNEMRF